MKINFKLHKKKKPADPANFAYANIDPAKDWYIILISFFIINCIGVIFSAYIFFRLGHHTPSSALAPAASQTDAGVSRLHKIVSEYSNRQNEFQSERSNEPSVGDPSL